MSHNPSFDMVMLAAERGVTVTGEEHHQAELGVLRPTGAGPRYAIAELRIAPIAHGSHAGRAGIEVRIDGCRVGELTHRMAERYLPIVEPIARQGQRPGCDARVKVGRRGLVEVELRLPDAGRAAAAAEGRSARRPGDGQADPRPPRGPRRGPSERMPRKALWIGLGIAGVVVVGSALSGGQSSPSSTAPVAAATAVAAPTSAAAPTAAAPTSAAPPTTASTTITQAEATSAPSATRPGVPAVAVPDTPRTSARTADPVPLAEPAPGPADEPAPASVYYKNCAAARAAGAAPVHRGDPGYAPRLDRDGDGIGCE